MTQLYRKSALEKLSSPEQLDKVLRLSSPLSWLVLVGITLIVIVVIIWSIVGRIPITVTASGEIASVQSDTITIYANEPGTVRSIDRDIGTEINFGDTLMTYQNENGVGQNVILYSDQRGYLKKTLVEVGASFKEGDALFKLSPIISYPETSLVVVCYVPSDKIPDMRRNYRDLELNVYPEGIESQSKGYMQARVINIDSRSTSVGGGDGTSGNQSFVVVTCELFPQKPDMIPKGAKNNFYWTNKKGYGEEVRSGTHVTVKIVVDKKAPIEKLFSKIREIWDNGKKD